MEKAFRVKKESSLYKNFFAKKNEEHKFIELANNFISKHNIKCDVKLYFSERLHLSLEEEYYKTIKDQLVKYCWHKDAIFKLNSLLNKAWKEEVYSKIDEKAINSTRLWYWDYTNVSGGMHALWALNDELYGYIETKDDTPIELSDDLEEIKMSEYYQIIENMNE